MRQVTRPEPRRVFLILLTPNMTELSVLTHPSPEFDQLNTEHSIPGHSVKLSSVKKKIAENPKLFLDPILDVGIMTMKVILK